MTTTEPRGKYAPRPDGLNALFYEETTANNAVRIQRCESCERVQHPPRYRCTSCGGDQLGWTESAGRGRIVSWVTTYRDVALGWEAELPYTTAIVELDEGVQVIGAFRVPDGDQPRVGTEVRVEIEAVSDSFARIWFSA